VGQVWRANTRELCKTDEVCPFRSYIITLIDYASHFVIHWKLLVDKMMRLALQTLLEAPLFHPDTRACILTTDRGREAAGAQFD
jgi:hypothetical protein